MPVHTLTTIDDVLALPEREDVRYEIDEGELIEMTLPRPLHNLIVVEIVTALRNWLRTSKAGMVFTSDAPFVLRRDPDILRGPDAAFIRADRASKLDLKALIEGAPDLAVEVASPNDRMKALLRKVTQYLEAGSEEVWLVLPESREVHVFNQDAAPRIVQARQSLESTILPGFSLQVDDIFG